MNKILGVILKSVEAVAVQVGGPAAQAIDTAAHNIADHKGSVDDNALDAAEAAIKLIEQYKGTDIADEGKFRVGVAGLEASFKLIRESLKPAA
jgi:hypothetical protein